jgi:glycosyltransferase involved in cell wall biosynthesis
LTNLKYHGFVEHTQVPAYMAAMDVLLAPPLPVTRSAGGRDIGRWMSPLKIFEYMAAGRPIVASDIPAVREILRDGVTALLVVPHDVEAWVSAMQRLEDATLAGRLAGQARADLVERYTWSARARSVVEHLQRRMAAIKQAKASRW